MATRRISKVSKRRLTILGTISIIFIISFIFSLFYNLYIIFNLNKDRYKLQTAYVDLQKEAEQLKIDIDKLGDPIYLANYAREHYLYSKDGEYILQMGEDYKKAEEVLDIVSVKIKRNYIIIGLSILMIIIFMYILLKGHKRKKKHKKKKKL